MDIEKDLNDLEVTASSLFKELNYLEKERDDLESEINNRAEELRLKASRIKMQCLDAMSAIHETNMLPDETIRELSWIEDLDDRADRLVDKCDSYIKE